MLGIPPSLLQGFVIRRESHGLIDTRIDAKPVNLGSTQRMRVQGCGHKATYHYDSANSVWVREPDATPSTASAK